MGLVKYAIIHKEGEIKWETLAAGLSHRPATARLGIDWLVAQGKLSIYVEEEELIVVRPEQQSPSSDVETIEAILKTNLAETRAYRQFFQKASLGSLLKVIH